MWRTSDGGVSVHSTRSHPSALTTIHHDLLSSERLDKVADSYPKQPDWDGVRFGDLFVIDRDLDFVGFIDCDLKVFVPAVRP